MTGPSILICDDEVEIAEELAEFLTDNGWRTQVCHSTAEARRMLTTGTPADALLSDLRLAEEDGLTLICFSLSLPADRRPQLHAIMTGYVVENTTADELGVDALYIKPVDPVKLCEDLGKRLAHRESAALGDG